MYSSLPNALRWRWRSKHKLAADGAAWVIRRSFDGTDACGGVENLLRHGCQAQSIPPDADGGYPFEDNAPYLRTRSDFVLLALPNPPSVTRRRARCSR